MSSLIYLPGQAPTSDRAVLSSMLNAHYLEIIASIAEGMVVCGSPDLGRSHVVLAVARHHKIGPKVIATAQMAGPDHKWATDMPALVMKVDRARRLLHGRAAREGLAGPPAPGHIFVFGVGDGDGITGDMCTVRAEWPLPVINSVRPLEVSP